MARDRAAADPIERLARSIDLLVKLKVEEIKGDRNQRDMIRFLAGLGASGPEISSVLGISRSTVDPELSKLKAAKNKKR